MAGHGGTSCAVSTLADCVAFFSGWFLAPSVWGVTLLWVMVLRVRNIMCRKITVVHSPKTGDDRTHHAPGNITLLYLDDRETIVAMLK